MAAHRYWRIYVTAAWANYVDFSTIEMREVPGGAELCEAAVTGDHSRASASSVFNQGTSLARFAFDGIPSSGWNSAAGMPQWIAVDLGVTRAVAEVKLTPRSQYPTEAPKDFAIQWSDNGSSWTTALAVTGAPSWSEGETRTYVVPVPLSVASITPTSGPTTGGTRITGTGTSLTGATGASVGGVAVSLFAVVNDGSWVGTTAPHAAGVVDVVLHHPSGDLTLAGAFTYVAEETPPPEGLICAPIVERGEAASRVGLDQLSSLELTVKCGETLALAGERIPLAAVKGVFRDARMRVERVYLVDGEPLGTFHVFEGRVEADPSSSVVKFSIESDAAALASIPLPRSPIQARCANVYFDAACGLDRGDFLEPGTVLHGWSRTRFGTDLAGDFGEGSIVFTSGVNQGERRPVVAFADGTVTVWPPLPAVPETGATFDAEPSCDHTPAACVARGNLARFRGQPFVPQESPLQSSTIESVATEMQFVAAQGEACSCRFKGDGTILFAAGQSTDIFPVGSSITLAGAVFHPAIGETIDLSGTYTVTAQTGTTLKVAPTIPWSHIADWYSEPGIGALTPEAAVTIAHAACLRVADEGSGFDFTEFMSGTITLLAGLAAGEGVRIGGVVFMGVAGVAGPNEWTVAATLEESAASLAKSINESTTAGVVGIVTATSAGAVVTLGARQDVNLYETVPHITCSSDHLFPAFSPGALAKITAGPWTGPDSVTRNLDGTYTVAALSAHTMYFVSPASVSAGWTGMPTSPVLIVQVEKG